MYALARTLFPLHRSMTGRGVRETLAILNESIPLQQREVATGTRVFDWTIPNEWSIRDAYIKDASGARLVDYRQSNLHVVNGSTAIDAQLSWAELKTHLHTSSQRPEAIPYRTQFFGDDWGFCVTRPQYESLLRSNDPSFHVHIDASHREGSLTYGEAVLPGRSTQELLIYTHLCHPSLANDNLSGIVVATQLATAIRQMNLHHTVRFVFAPATLGAIAWLSNNRAGLQQIRAGLNLTLLGDDAPLQYKRSRIGNSLVDRAAASMLSSGHLGSMIPFTPFGYDERQFCSPGINLPFGRLTRSAPGEFPEYHTSDDNLDFISSQALQESFEFCLELLQRIDRSIVYHNQFPFCEPQLGKFDLYRGYADTRVREEDDAAYQRELQTAMMWLLNLADGSRDLLQIAEQSAQDFDLLHRAAELLLHHRLIKPSPHTPPAESGNPT